ncbi:LytS/YhcK type 5TM receptor domain-containing protein [Erysipelothrix urinaevulpis]|uniref:LytS/YhcK type 5TM receptor domain-containing protein n=1 Tax=Erysipelothrix urinaevulpis TaxID=2683717 RepID=UPI00135A8849|nr:LytS/YhcK type 5TM receptor domain-containing protein [Erysipelothrix urinaevulpis]
MYTKSTFVEGDGIILDIALNNLTHRITLILMIAFLISNTSIIKRAFLKQNLSLRDIIVLSLIFGAMGILGTYTGIEINGALANSRVVGVFVGGLLGGPLVGLLTGIITGLHRYLIDINGFTALACALATFIAGIMSGKLSGKFHQTPQKVKMAFFWGAISEVLQMFIILLISKPYSDALELVKLIGIPMIFSNAFGIAAFIAIMKNIYKEVETEAAYQSQLSLQIADETLKYFRTGLNEETALKIAKIIKKYTNIDAIAFTDCEKILAHVGVAGDHHNIVEPLQTSITKEVIESGEYKICSTKNEISCTHKRCPLKAAIIVPLKKKDQVIGTLKLYKKTEHSITKVEIQLALGLARLFSTQLELSDIDAQKELLTKAELKALQSQINPHFLFNAINTIAYLIRIDPNEGRRLLLHLGKYFRNNLDSKYDDVSIHHEIENVNSYLEIEKARFGSKLTVNVELDQTLECDLPPLIIQPLVENAIKHGLGNKLEGGTVKIIVQEEKDDISIVVMDDGVGMTQSVQQYCFSNHDKKSSIGIQNVNDRLVHKYGKDYSLRIKSEVNVGTHVYFKVPKARRSLSV